MNRKQRRHNAGKPQGMSYADQLAYRRQLQQACQKAANAATVQVEADIRTQRAMWLMCVSMNDAFQIGPQRFAVFAEALQKRTDWYEDLVRGGDEEYANEKLRREAERCSGIKIDYLYEAEIRAAQKLTENEPVTNFQWLRASEYRLAEFICKHTECHRCPGQPYCKPTGEKGNGLVEWLKAAMTDD